FLINPLSGCLINFVLKVLNSLVQGVKYQRTPDRIEFRLTMS
ncbi:MAG: hypothetical protein K0S93_1579, partial [Nitrososphaeraceae archaeon]|nr:hypothetical protein [Nitrososphaeraceae archaeon]